MIILIFFFLIHCLNSIQTYDYATDKTYLQPRNQGWSTSLFHEEWYNRTRNSPEESNKQIHIACSFFFEKSRHNKAFSTYFSPKSPSFTIGTVSPDQIEELLFPQVDTSLMIHDAHQTTFELTHGSIEGSRHQWGICFNASSLGKLEDLNYICSITCPFVVTKHTASFQLESPLNGIKEFLEGTYSYEGNPNKQGALTAAKINGKTQQSIGLADTTIKGGIYLINNEHYDATASLICIIPTSNKPEGEFLFEPLRGNGHFWGIGVTIDQSCEITNNNFFSTEFRSCYTLLYHFPQLQKRTLQCLTDLGCSLPWNQYYLIGKDGFSKLEPLANYSTMLVSVAPNFSWEYENSITISGYGASLSCCYKLSGSEEESITIPTWLYSNIGLANNNFDTANLFDLKKQSSFNPIIDISGISKNKLHPKPAQAPSDISHIFSLVGSGTIQLNNEQQLSLSLGGYFSPTSKRYPLRTLGLFCTIIINF